MKRIILLILAVVLFYGCGGNAPYKLGYLWKPKNDFGRELKAKYVTELLSVYDNVKLSGLKIRESGIGFTGADSCEMEWNCKEGNFYMFIIVDDGQITNLKFKNYEDRVLKIKERYYEDVKYLLKRSDIKKIIEDEQFGGVILDLNWTLRDIKKITKPVYESAKFFIKKDELIK